MDDEIIYSWCFNSSECFDSTPSAAIIILDEDLESFLSLKSQQVVVKMVIFIEDLLRRDSGNKVILKEVPDIHTNFTSLDENSIPQNLQIYKEALRAFDRVLRYPNRYVGHIVMNNVDTLHLKGVIL